MLIMVGNIWLIMSNPMGVKGSFIPKRTVPAPRYPLSFPSKSSFSIGNNVVISLD